MAQRVQVLLVCDLHGDDTPGTETISFSVDGGAYEIDACDAHAADLRDAFAPFVGAARRAGGGAGRSSGRRGSSGRVSRGGVGGDRQRTADIRGWARNQGLKVPDRGRLPGAIIEQYESAH